MFARGDTSCIQVPGLGVQGLKLKDLKATLVSLNDIRVPCSLSSRYFEAQGAVSLLPETLT